MMQSKKSRIMKEYRIKRKKKSFLQFYQMTLCTDAILFFEDFVNAPLHEGVMLLSTD